MNTKSFLICLITLLFFCQCKEECTELYMPVCGNDGKNYLNACKANNAKVSFTEGLCTSTVNGRVVDLGNTADDWCRWVFKIDTFSTFERPFPNIHYGMYNFPDEFKEDGLNIEIVYNNVSDAIGGCFISEELIDIIYFSGAELRKI